MMLAFLVFAVMAASEPLAVPGNFDASVNMLSERTEVGAFHETRVTSGFAARLLANGAPQDIELAVKALDAVLACQELHPNGAHYGNFRWMLEDKAVEDLNAVEFVLSDLIPMMIRHGDRLPSAVRDRVIESIRLGLAEIRRMDVAIAYTNITSLDVANSCLGGELLKDQETAQRGHQKLAAWEALTMQSGTPFEFNSPTYLRVTTHALKELCDLVQDPDTHIRARTLATRIALDVALHIHRGTGRWAGPHSRAYHPTVVCQARPEAEMVREWTKNGTAEAWIAAVLDGPALPFQVAETAYAGWAMGLTTYQSPSFAMGLATRQLNEQSDVFIIHYNRPGAERHGVVYSRYLTNDKWLGDWYHSGDRSRFRNLNEEGKFLGVQSGPRAIGLYRPSTLDMWSSIKAVLIWTERKLVDEIWIGDQRVENLPALVPPGKVVVVASGQALVAVLPLTRKDLGHDAPVRLVEIKGDLVLEMYNYLGPEKVFWELESPGGFFQGWPQCGFYAEAAERSQYPDGKAFADAVAKGALTDKARAPFTYMERDERPWTVEYARDGQTLGIEADLMTWKLLRRWNQDGELGWPMLESPVARQNAEGKVSVGDATLTCGKSPAWLFGDPNSKTWAAGYHGESAPLTLTVPGGKVEVQAMGTGTVVWQNGAVTVEAIGLQDTPAVTGGTLANPASPGK